VRYVRVFSCVRLQSTATTSGIGLSRWVCSSCSYFYGGYPDDLRLLFKFKVMIMYYVLCVTTCTRTCTSSSYCLLPLAGVNYNYKY